MRMMERKLFTTYDFQKPELHISGKIYSLDFFKKFGCGGMQLLCVLQGFLATGSKAIFRGSHFKDSTKRALDKVPRANDLI